MFKNKMEVSQEKVLLVTTHQYNLKKKQLQNSPAQNVISRHHGTKCYFTTPSSQWRKEAKISGIHLLLTSKPPLYFLNPFKEILSPRRPRNSSNSLLPVAENCT